ncbi:gag/pol protein [Cucumis melo var. makuwa]|uniref:Gag/pol protein n=1 Tax=Cucumis melo var. makuwa TaxID=1194695 RepID=A0A5D3BH07_CUCMM|nr:gag/pol protein [Cucumis melo var. makuwa]
MILVIVDLRFVLMEECPPFPTKNASQSVRDAYDRWNKANDKGRLHILASMSDILSKKHEIMVTSRQIMESLREMFGQPSIQIKQEANVAHSRRAKGRLRYLVKKGKCFHCNVDEHWKTNCPKYLVKKEKKEGATNHVCSSLQETSSFKQLEESEMTLKVGTGDVISARAMGDAKKNDKETFNEKGYRAKEPLELIHSDLCSPMNVKARGGFEYFISFIDDYSREYMDLRFQDYMIEHEIQCQLSAPVETTVHILNNVPSNSVSETPFELWRGRKPSLSHFRIWGCPAHVLVTNPKKLESRSRLCQFVGYPKETRGGLFFDPQVNRVFVSTNATFLEEDHMRDHKPRSKLVLNEATDESTRVVDEVGPSSRVNETTTSDDGVEDSLFYEQATNDVDKDQWVKAMDLEMESMYFNSMWELVDLPEGVKPIGCKWIYKRKRDSAGKSIRILLSIAIFYDYEIWQMDVKIAYLNDNHEESIFMSQPEGFITQGQEQKVCKLNRSIYGLKQASRSWNIRFDTAIKSNSFDQNVDEPYVYKKINKEKVAFLVLYVDDILLIGNDVAYLTDVKAWLAAQFQMKDLGEAQYVLGIQIIRDRKNKTLVLSQATYIDKMLVRYSMQNSKNDLLPFRHGVHLSKEQCPKTPQEVEDMRRIFYVSAVGSLMYVMLCTKSDIYNAVGIVSRYQSNPGLDHWTDSRKSTSGSVFTLNGGAVEWCSIKQGCIADSTMEAGYVTACEAAKEVVWLRKFLHDLEVVPNMNLPITLYCDNSGTVVNSKEPRSHKRGKHIERKYHLIREIVQRRDVIVTKIASEHNIADLFTKTLTAKVFEGHLESLGLRDMYIR